MNSLCAVVSGSLSDLRDACRALRRAPGQTLTVLFCLTLGSTLTVLMFGVVNAILAGEVPGVRDRGTLVLVVGESGSPRELQSLTAGDYRALPAGLPGLAAVGAEDSSRGFAVNLDGLATTARGKYVSGDYFQTLGTRPIAGRVIERGDDKPDAMPVAVLSHQFAAPHFGGAAAAVGQEIRIGPGMVTIVGVLPAGFAGLRLPDIGEAPEDRGDIWVPMAQRRGLDAAAAVADDQVGPAIVARLADGVNRNEAEARLAFLAGQFNAERPRHDPLAAVRLVPFHLFDSDMTFIDRLGGAAGLMAVPLMILAIACANVAAVSLSRAVDRTHELAVRVSLGATRPQVARLLALEIGLVAVAAGVAAWVITTQVIRPSARILPFVVAADVRVFLFSLVLPIAVTATAGLLPAWRATGFDVLAGLRLGPRVGGTARPHVRRAITVAQIVLSVSLLATASYLVRAYASLPATFGLLQDDVLVADVRFLNLELTSQREALSRLAILDQARRLPGVTVAAAGERLLSQTNGRSARHVTEDWFQAAGLRIRGGRGFGADEARVAVVNETWAATLGGLDKAIGAQIVVHGERTADVIGVVENAYERAAWGHPVPVAYVPMDRLRPGEFTLYLRGPAASSAAPAVRAILAAVDPALAPSEIGTIADALARHYRGPLAIARALGAMSAVAMVLVAVGLFGATAQAVIRRTHEFGVRLALGARPRAIASRVLRETLATTLTGGLTGLALGAGVLWALVPADSDELNLLDPIPAVVTIGAIVAIGLAAAAAPARRVMAIDPAESLRAD